VILKSAQRCPKNKFVLLKDVAPNKLILQVIEESREGFLFIKAMNPSFLAG
jgi:hypothetical protein